MFLITVPSKSYAQLPVLFCCLNTNARFGLSLPVGRP
jgi:hypothetical protein